MMHQPEEQTLFEGGIDGCHTYRIPALINASNGDLLAFCEGRRDSSSDFGQIDLLMKRSSDDARTWSGQSVIATEPGMTCGNLCPVVDSATGEVLMLFCKNRADTGMQEILRGEAERTVWITRSSDSGQTWSDPAEITPQVKKNVWSWYATGPGHGIQLSGGRLIIPCDHKTYAGFPHDKPRLGSHLIYSDDHGESWRIGAILTLPGNECYALEGDDGSVYLNCRTMTEHGVRSYGISRDSGLSFIEEGFHDELGESSAGSGCQGSLLKLPARDDDHRSLFLFCSIYSFVHPTTNEKDRRRLTLHVSSDRGRSWRECRVLCEGPAAYSDLALTAGGSVLCLYETGANSYRERLVLSRFSPEWLLEGQNTGA